jgi:hypothetical protein
MGKERQMIQRQKGRAWIGLGLSAALMGGVVASIAPAGAAVGRIYRDLDRDGIRDSRDWDRDGDGIRNSRDPYPNRRNNLRRYRSGRTSTRYRSPITTYRIYRDRDGDRVPDARDRYPSNRRRW